MRCNARGVLFAEKELPCDPSAQTGRVEFDALGGYFYVRSLSVGSMHSHEQGSR